MVEQGGARLYMARKGLARSGRVRLDRVLSGNVR